MAGIDSKDSVAGETSSSVSRADIGRVAKGIPEKAILGNRDRAKKMVGGLSAGARKLLLSADKKGKVEIGLAALISKKAMSFRDALNTVKELINKGLIKRIGTATTTTAVLTNDGKELKSVLKEESAKGKEEINKEITPEVNEPVLQSNQMLFMPFIPMLMFTDISAFMSNFPLWLGLMGFALVGIVKIGDERDVGKSVMPDEGEYTPEIVELDSGQRVRIYGVTHGSLLDKSSLLLTGSMHPALKGVAESSGIVALEKHFYKTVIPQGDYKRYDIDMKRRREWDKLAEGMDKSLKGMIKSPFLGRLWVEEDIKAVRRIEGAIKELDEKEKEEKIVIREDWGWLSERFKTVSKADWAYYYPFVRAFTKGRKVSDEEIGERVLEIAEIRSTLVDSMLMTGKTGNVMWGELYQFLKISYDLPLRDAYMAEKIAKVLAKHPEIKELPVVVGRRHKERVFYYLENPKERQLLIEFFKEETPLSYRDLQNFPYSRYERLSRWISSKLEKRPETNEENKKTNSGRKQITSLDFAKRRIKKAKINLEDVAFYQADKYGNMKLIEGKKDAEYAVVDVIPALERFLASMGRDLGSDRRLICADKKLLPKLKPKRILSDSSSQSIGGIGNFVNIEKSSEEISLMAKIGIETLDTASHEIEHPSSYFKGPLEKSPLVIIYSLFLFSTSLSSFSFSISLFVFFQLIGLLYSGPEEARADMVNMSEVIGKQGDTLGNMFSRRKCLLLAISPLQLRRPQFLTAVFSSKFIRKANMYGSPREVRNVFGKSAYRILLLWWKARSWKKDRIKALVPAKEELKDRLSEEVLDALEVKEPAVISRLAESMKVLDEDFGWEFSNQILSTFADVNKETKDPIDAMRVVMTIEIAGSWLIDEIVKNKLKTKEQARGFVKGQIKEIFLTKSANKILETLPDSYWELIISDEKLSEKLATDGEEKRVRKEQDLRDDIGRHISEGQAGIVGPQGKAVLFNLNSKEEMSKEELSASGITYLFTLGVIDYAGVSFMVDGYKVLIHASTPSALGLFLKEAFSYLVEEGVAVEDINEVKVVTNKRIYHRTIFREFESFNPQVKVIYSNKELSLKEHTVSISNKGIMLDTYKVIAPYKNSFYVFNVETEVIEKVTPQGEVFEITDKPEEFIKLKEAIKEVIGMHPDKNKEDWDKLFSRFPQLKPDELMSIEATDGGSAKSTPTLKEETVKNEYSLLLEACDLDSQERHEILQAALKQTRINFSVLRALPGAFKSAIFSGEPLNFHKKFIQTGGYYTKGRIGINAYCKPEEYGDAINTLRVRSGHEFLHKITEEEILDTAYGNGSILTNVYTYLRIDNGEFEKMLDRFLNRFKKIGKEERNRLKTIFIQSLGKGEDVAVNIKNDKYVSDWTKQELDKTKQIDLGFSPNYEWTFALQFVALMWAIKMSEMYKKEGIAATIRALSQSKLSKLPFTFTVSYSTTIQDGGEETDYKNSANLNVMPNREITLEVNEPVFQSNQMLLMPFIPMLTGVDIMGFVSGFLIWMGLKGSVTKYENVGRVLKEKLKLLRNPDLDKKV